MKQTLTVIAAIALGAFSFAAGATFRAGRTAAGISNPLEEMSFDAQPDRCTKGKGTANRGSGETTVKTIHQEAMTKAKAVMDASLTQIRPLLTQEQQTKLDGIMKAHEDMHNAMKELHEAKAK